MSGLNWSFAALYVYAGMMLSNYVQGVMINRIARERARIAIGRIIKVAAMGYHGDPIPQARKRFQLMIKPVEKPVKIPKVGDIQAIKSKAVAPGSDKKMNSKKEKSLHSNEPFR